MGVPYKGDPELGERQFVDQKPWEPPLYDKPEVSGDPFWKRARDYSDVATEEAASTPSGIATPGLEPGVSEFSYGRGLMAPVGLADPTQMDELHAVMRTNPADPNANHLDRYADWTRE